MFYFRIWFLIQLLKICICGILNLLYFGAHNTIEMFGKLRC